MCTKQYQGDKDLKSQVANRDPRLNQTILVDEGKHVLWEDPLRGKRPLGVFMEQYEIFDFDLGNTFDHSDMARMIAPRPFMVERGHDDGVAYDEYVGFEFGKVCYYYDMCLKMPERAEIHFEPGGHFPFLTHALPFLDKWLKTTI